MVETVHSSGEKEAKEYHAGRHWNLLEWLNNVDNTAALPSSLGRCRPSISSHYQHESKLVPHLLSEWYARSQDPTKNKTP